MMYPMFEIDGGLWFLFGGFFVLGLFFFFNVFAQIFDLEVAGLFCEIKLFCHLCDEDEKEEKVKVLYLLSGFLVHR